MTGGNEDAATAIDGWDGSVVAKLLPGVAYRLNAAGEFEVAK